MLTTKEKRFIKRIEQLIKEGKEITKLEKPAFAGPYIQDEDKIKLHAWLTKVKNIVRNIFEKESEQFNYLKELTSGNIEHSYQIYPIVGLLEGAKDDIENGFLVKQELIIAGEVFDSVLEQANYLNNKGYKDPAAVLARVVLEDVLKRIACEENIDFNQKSSVLNTNLKEKGRYPKSQWRLIQGWLDIGNDAAHGNFDNYSHKDINKLIRDINTFLASHLS